MRKGEKEEERERQKPSLQEDTERACLYSRACLHFKLLKCGAIARCTHRA